MSEIRNLTRNGETFYPLTTTSAVINEATGEGLIIDEVPTKDSNNLVKSGGVAKQLIPITGDVSKTYRETLPGAPFSTYVYGSWSKGTVIYISANSQTTTASSIFAGVMYPEGEEQNVIPGMELNKEYALELKEDCTRVHIWIGYVSTSGDLEVSVRQKNSIENLTNNIEYLVSKTLTNPGMISIGGYFSKGEKVIFNVSSDNGGVADFLQFGLLTTEDVDLNNEINSYNFGKDIEYTIRVDSKIVRVWVIPSTSGEFKFKVKKLGVDSNTARFNFIENLQNRNISVLGDSYSAYYGWIPNGYSPWYGIGGVDGHNAEQNDVNSVTDMWWYKLCEKTKSQLLLNGSYSGSPICNTGYNGGDASGYSFVTRMVNDLGSGRSTLPKPGLILVFGGTNDSWAGSPLGTFKYSGWTSDDLKQVFPAACYMFDYIKKWNPGARIINIINTQLNSELVSGLIGIANHYCVENLQLVNIGKDSSHPNKSGHESICNQVLDRIGWL